MYLGVKTAMAVCREEQLCRLWSQSRFWARAPVCARLRAALGLWSPSSPVHPASGTPCSLSSLIQGRRQSPNSQAAHSSIPTRSMGGQLALRALTLKEGCVHVPPLESLPSPPPPSADAILGGALHRISWCLKPDMLSPGQGCPATERVAFWNGDLLITEAEGLFCRIICKHHYQVVNPSIF